ncbi:MAG: hypothetical protein SP1CHLAM54_17790 [Chlamydiia bacterium]|nr:hypothetical protein [Chlamydiia bacterium]MCH9616667.1 hypothetical protein [Chlamydiia bacterium]MCH9629399.1 hypothetical protein [Chlamydiia bacterium]
MVAPITKTTMSETELIQGLGKLAALLMATCYYLSDATKGLLKAGSSENTKMNTALEKEKEDINESSKWQTAMSYIMPISTTVLGLSMGTDFSNLGMEQLKSGLSSMNGALGASKGIVSIGVAYYDKEKGENEARVNVAQNIQATLGTNGVNVSKEEKAAMQTSSNVFDTELTTILQNGKAMNWSQN